MSQAPFALAGHNPDVLTCIANLSNDEVFTPPEFANRMLDTLAQSWATSKNGESIWANKEVTFLDPCTKSGVFLREIVKRLNEGLTKEIPDLTERINHILTKQIFGIGITELTSLLARRSVYCSKNAKGIHSIGRTFSDDDGNIWFERAEHKWIGQNCKFCGANKSEYKRSNDLETHAYTFIHSDNIKVRIAELFGEKMQFDIIIGNPPYQLGDSGFGASARPIYHLFVDQAKSLDPRYLCMVIPARWYAGGKGLDDFRSTMLNDKSIRVLHDYADSTDIFPGTLIKGGICYFLWDRDEKGHATVVTHDKGKVIDTQVRPLLEKGCDIFIRYETGLEILKKVLTVEAGLKSGPIQFSLPIDKRFSSLVSVRKPFGFQTDFRGRLKQEKGDIEICQIGGSGFVNKSQVKLRTEWIETWKVFVAYAGSGDQYPNPVIGKPFVGPPKTICTETYLHIGPFKDKKVAEIVSAYMASSFFRFMILLRKTSQHVTRSVYNFVPLQDFSEEWTDEKLYKKYGITKDEIAFIESMIRPMKLDND